jgi:hypothetical protein
MNKEERKLQFREYLNTCMNKDIKELIGLGNPYAKILLIGQESAIEVKEGDENVKIEEVNNTFIESLNNRNFQYIYHQPRFYPDRIDKKGNRIFNKTWNAYQKLIDYIRPEEKRCKDPNYTDFCMDAFTTEINNTISVHRASKRILRIDTFKNSDYIKGFPVIILACSDYIRNVGNNRQIDDTFDVTFDLSDGAHKYCGRMNFYTHHSADRRRLVIHTRQLSQYSDTLLHGMAEEIQKHFDKIGESYEAVSY